MLKITGEFLKNNEYDLDGMHFHERSLKKAMRKNCHVMCQTTEFSKKLHEKTLLVNFPGCQHVINISKVKDVDKKKVKKS